ncbi:MAG: RNA polymerase sigma factor SigZ [Pseudomonadota bacterium]
MSEPDASPPLIEDVWRDYRHALGAYLRARVADPDDAEDLLQEVLIRSHRSLARLRDSENLRGWLFRIARNATMDFYRRKGRAATVHADDLWYAAPDADVHGGLEACIRPFIAALPETDAALLTAIDIEGVSQKDYAAARGLSYSTLKSRVQSARGKLRGLFEDCCAMVLDHQGNIMDYRQKSECRGDC